MAAPDIAPSIALPGVVLLILFLSYSSQYFFLHFEEPGPLSTDETITFNALVACIWICYARAILTDPGRVPPGWTPDISKSEDGEDDAFLKNHKSRQRWCRKCEAAKPPRAHHCKVCNRCILRMDHHCPWTANCVSYITMPHFVRFLLYCVAAMTQLEYFLYLRGKVIWDSRHLPSYLGPSMPQLIHLFVLLAANSFTLFMLSILFIRTIWTIGSNTSTIESWEIERHETLLRRARATGGYLNGPDGQRVLIKRQEFPYDIGIWQNFRQAFDTANVLVWVWPLARSLRAEDGLSWEENGFEDEGTVWPPPDPDRMPRIVRKFDPKEALLHDNNYETYSNEEIENFKRRQQADMARYGAATEGLQRRKPFYQRQWAQSQGVNVHDDHDEDEDGGYAEDGELGEEAWRNREGDRLRDFGVDEDIDFYDQNVHYDDEDNVPLAELIKRRKAAANP